MLYHDRDSRDTEREYDAWFVIKARCLQGGVDQKVLEQVPSIFTYPAQWTPMKTVRRILE